MSKQPSTYRLENFELVLHLSGSLHQVGFQWPRLRYGAMYITEPRGLDLYQIHIVNMGSVVQGAQFLGRSALRNPDELREVLHQRRIPYVDELEQLDEGHFAIALRNKEDKHSRENQIFYLEKKSGGYAYRLLLLLPDKLTAYPPDNQITYLENMNAYQNWKVQFGLRPEHIEFPRNIAGKGVAALTPFAAPYEAVQWGGFKFFYS